MEISREEKRALEEANRALEERRSWRAADVLLAPLRLAKSVGSVLLKWARPRHAEADDE
ncbi:MAG: hypothetical protein ACOCV2_02310 [Persicimonas sp.]